MSDREDELHAAHRVRYSMRERVAGLLIIGALVLLALSIVFNDRVMFMFAETFSLNAYIENANDVDDGAAVKLDGIEIGRVDTVELTDDAKIRVVLKIRKHFHEQVREDSVLQVNHLAVLGGGGVSISRGNPGLPMLEDGATIKVKETASMGELLSQITPAIDDIIATTDRVHEIVESIEPETTAAIVDDVSAISRSVRELVGKFNQGGGVGGLLHDDAFAADVAKSVDELAAVLEITKQRLRDLGPVVENTETVTAELPALINESRRLVDELTNTVDAIDSGNERVPGILLEARATLNEAKQTLRAIQNIWPISSNMPEDEQTEAVPPQPPGNP